MRTLVELPGFTKQAAAVWSEAEYEEFTLWLAQNPDAGVVVPASRGARKVRWKRESSGKSAGARVIYYHLVAAEQIVLVAVYAKSGTANIPANKILNLLK
jgi:plasmid stabilization system protein ParE